MVRCNSLFKRSLPFVVFCGFLVLWFSGPLVCHGQVYGFGSNSPPVVKKSDATVSVRDLSIPRKAFDAYRRGLQRLQKQDNTGSIRDFSKAIEKFPQFYEAYYHLGVAQKRLGLNDQALASFQTAANLSDGKYTLAAYASALLLCKQGKTAEAERTVLYALESNDSPGPGHLGNGYALYEPAG